jgi:hypothetical protein
MPRCGPYLWYRWGNAKHLQGDKHFKRGNFVPLHDTKIYTEKEGIAPLILTLGTRGRRVVNFTPRFLCSPEMNPVPIEKEAELAP